MKIYISLSSFATEAAELQHAIGDKFHFDYAKRAARASGFSYEQGAKTAIGKYLRLVWRRANAKFFESRLKQPSRFAVLCNDFNSAYDNLASWHSDRTLSLRTSSFNAPEEGFVLHLIVHEMCHQAVDELSGGARLSHGKAWSDWMRKCNLTPDPVIDSNVFRKVGRGTEDHTLRNMELIDFNNRLRGLKRII